jgi:hypothetical protein
MIDEVLIYPAVINTCHQVRKTQTAFVFQTCRDFGFRGIGELVYIFELITIAIFKNEVFTTSP